MCCIPPDPRLWSSEDVYECERRGTVIALMGVGGRAVFGTEVGGGRRGAASSASGVGTRRDSGVDAETDDALITVNVGMGTSPKVVSSGPADRGMGVVSGVRESSDASLP